MNPAESEWHEWYRENLYTWKTEYEQKLRSVEQQLVFKTLQNEPTFKIETATRRIRGELDDINLRIENHLRDYSVRGVT